LTHLQRYLFTKLNIEPCSKVIVEYDGQNLVSIEKIEDNDIKSPFSVMHAEIILQSDSQVLDLEDSIKQIEAKLENEQTLVFEGDESKTLTDFCNYVVSTDPDVIVFSNYDLNILNYLFGRMKVLSLNLQLGRYKIDAYFQNQIRIIDKWTQGRIYITERQFSEAGIEGIIELSRFSHLPVRQLLRYCIGRLVANRIFFELLQRDFVITDKFEASYEQIRTLEEIIDKDKAGMIFSPLVGLHQNIAVLDFNDEFSNIIINENISYEPKNKDN
jgi:DNA polymerase elongation subunit (family B)